MFELDAGTVVAFTDGSCYPNRACPESVAGYAVCFALGCFKDVIIYGNIKNRPEFATSQRAEGTAILRVMEYLEGGPPSNERSGETPKDTPKDTSNSDEEPEETKSRLKQWERCIIVTDSEFWINMIEKYMPSWAHRGEEAFDEKKNPDLTKKLWSIYSRLTGDLGKTIEIRHMKSHGKDGWQKKSEDSYEYFCYTNNEYVDQLATFARQSVEVGRDIYGKADYE
jgi:ribonuclease HI